MREDSATFTVDDAFLSMRFGKFQALVLAYAGMGWVSEAMEMMLLSFVGPSVRMEWKLSSYEDSMITSAVFVGMLLGAYSWGIVSDNYGRRMGFLFTALLTSGAGFLSAFSPNYLCLVSLRFIVGMGLGGGPVLASWFLEFVPSPNRGYWMIVFSFFWTIGTILEASLAWVVMPSLGWRWLLVFSSAPSFLLLLFYGFVPESPRYLCMKGRTADAMVVLESMAKINSATLPPGLLISNHKAELDETIDPSEESPLVTRSKTDTATDEDVGSNIGGISALYKLLSPKLIRSTLLIWMVFFGNAFAYYGIVLLTTELSNDHRDCTLKELRSIQTKDVNLYGDVFITSFAEVPGLLLSAVIVDRVGRKLSMAGLLFVSCIFLLPLIFHQEEALTTTLLFGARACIMGSFTIIYIYAPEVYPTSVRATGVGIASSVGRIGGIICPLVAVGLVHGCHQAGAILLFESVILLSGLATLFLPLETSGRALTDSVQ
ncbi:organic cation/carnitine transporter 7 isoform X1 [Elaeis guineensis]|uniref:Organic cation/carnitine transporter 7 isoform X1 n=1 Tax=Elaeis guineensis var. tenera TaxID=51953 RepID=A0A6J0PK94_ELAGV|nr:organic cation/carnitine transporter 7 isoform X1 [Elaeis guineensis]XP_010927138.1 organic cation/carnitine transporter 7 isoform X1 [Elaeis guineensis]XP_019707382.1 organic cation/carnitine transporter 7 isoform X1 [Elaeis guineensis]